MSKPQKFKAKVAEHILINDMFQYIDMELIEPHWIEFEAGQFISIDIGGRERRSYSIASKPTDNHEVEICVDITPAGKGTTYLKNLKPGDEVSLLGPLGQFTLSPEKEKEKKLLFVATGSGIAPLRSMLFKLLETDGDKREMKLYWGLRFVEDMFWEEDFRMKHEFFPNFDYQLLLSRPPDPRWPLESGYVTDEIKELKLDSSWGIYICGNPSMMTEIKELAKKAGVPEDQVHFEKFF